MLSRLKWTDAAKGRIAILNQYEPIQPYLLQELSREICADIFLDIGANIGAYSIMMAHLPTIQEVHAFEPMSQTYSQLQLNIAQNAYASKIKTHQIALSDQAGTKAFGVISELSGANCIIDTSIHPEQKFTQRVNVRTSELDSVLNISQRVISIKIDVEGHELQVLRGAAQTLTNNRCIVQIEDYQAENNGQITFLLNSGYKWLFNVGPDNYFSNMPQWREGTLVRAFSAASSTMIFENFAALNDQKTLPVRIRLPLGITIEAAGAIAQGLRAIRKSFM